MVDRIARRHLLAVGAGGLSSLAGCQSILDSDVSIVAYVLNSTEQSQDAYLQLNHPNGDSIGGGRIVPIESGIVKKVNFAVPPGTYHMMLNIDDVDPRPEKTVEWKVVNNECAKERYWTILPSEEGLTLQLAKRKCDDPQ